MRLSYEVIHEAIGRLPGGEFSGTGKWNVYKCTYKGKTADASFIMAMNPDEGIIEFQPQHPNDRRLLLGAFDIMLSFKGNRN
jgi:hypothetical protein